MVNDRSITNPDVKPGQRAPRISVLMTTYNGASTVAESIACVLSQDVEDFELIVVDDASSDETVAIIRRFADPRIRLVCNSVNLGVVGARNRGFAEVRGDYIAAMDQDDLCKPNRFRSQLDYFDMHPETVLVATEIEILRHGRTAAPDHPAFHDPYALRFLLHIDNPLTWSSVMFRTDAARRLGEFMRPECALADDFDLYHRLLAQGQIARLAQVLVSYRYHDSNLSLARGDVLEASSVRVLADAYAPWFGESAPRAAALATQHLCQRQPVSDAATLNEVGQILARLAQGFCEERAASQSERNCIMGLAREAWWRVVRAAVRNGSPWLVWSYWHPALGRLAIPAMLDLGGSILVGTARATMRR